jgi:hypothetical protein
MMLKPYLWVRRVLIGRLTLLVLSVCSTSMVFAEQADMILMDETYISGNQELPKVLYILPWKNQQSKAVPAGNPVLADRNVLTPIYPHEFRLQMRYRELIEKGRKL